jgi:hypothetical protein
VPTSISVQPAISSLVSANGPSTTRPCPAESYSTRKSWLLGCSPAPSTSTPAFAISSWKAIILGTSVGSSGKSPASLIGAARTWTL